MLCSSSYDIYFDESLATMIKRTTELEQLYLIIVGLDATNFHANVMNIYNLSLCYELLYRSYGHFEVDSRGALSCQTFRFVKLSLS